MNDIKPLQVLTGLSSSSLQRPIFKPGMLLEDEDLTTAVEYTRNMMRLMFRSLFGCGVVCGLKVKAKLTCKGRKLEVTVDKGVALDCLGDIIEVPATTAPLVYDPDCKPWPPKGVWVVVCYHEKCCRPRDISCSPDDDGRPVSTRRVSGFEIQLLSNRPECACSCEPPPAGKPRTNADGCCEDEIEPRIAAGATAAEPTAKQDDLCGCYEEQVIKAMCGCDCDCNCVVLGKIDTSNLGTPQENDLALDSDTEPTIRRDVRPVPVGYLLSCFQPQHENNVAAADERMKAAEERMKAAEERMKAGDERMKAAEERTKAAEEHIKVLEATRATTDRPPGMAEGVGEAAGGEPRAGEGEG